VTAEELIAKCRELALAPREGDADLDAMSAEEAWDKCCYAAWVDRVHRRRAQAVAAVMAEAHAQFADMAAEMILEHQRKQ
jgi:hypothetical protein